MTRHLHFLAVLGGGQKVLPLSLTLAIIVVGLITPSLSALPQLYEQLLRQARTIGGLAALPPLFAYCAAFAWLLWRAAHDRPLRTPTFALILGILFLVRLAWVLTLNPELVSDFKTYWTVASTMAQDGPDFPLDSVGSLRAFPYFAPSIVVFGNHSLTYKVANVAVMGLATFFVYQYSQKRFSLVTAQVAAILCNLAPETYAASAITSHDIPGVMFLSLIGLSILLLDQQSIQRNRLTISLGLAIILAILVRLTDIQRFPADFVVLSLLLAATLSILLQIKEPTRSHDTLRLLFHRTLFIALVPGFIVLMTLPLSTPYFGSWTDDNKAAERSLAFWHSQSKGDFASYKAIHSAFLRVATEQKKELGLHLFLSDLADSPLHRIKNIERRSKRLFQFGSQAGFYLRGYEGSIIFSVYKLSATCYALLTCVMTCLIIFSITPCLLRPPPYCSPEVITDWPIMFTALLGVVLISLEENQPRYMFPLYFTVIPWLVASTNYLITGFSKARSNFQASIRLLIDNGLVVGAVTLGLLVMWTVLGKLVDRSFHYDNGRIVNLERASGISVTTLSKDEIVERLRETGGPIRNPVFGPYGAWIGPASERNGTQPLEWRICHLDPDRNWRAQLYYGNVIGEPGAARHCVIGSGDAIRVDCAQGEGLTVRKIVMPGLRPDSSGCVEVFLELHERGNRASDASQSDEMHWISLMQIKPEPREPENDVKGEDAGFQ